MAAILSRPKCVKALSCVVVFVYIDWLNSFIFVIADNVQYRYKTQQYHTKHEDKMALVTKIS